MIVVKLELWPRGDQAKAVELGVAHIANDGTGDVDEEFTRWCEAEKPCKYCREYFRGPVCPCEALEGNDG